MLQKPEPPIFPIVFSQPWDLVALQGSWLAPTSVWAEAGGSWTDSSAHSLSILGFSSIRKSQGLSVLA